MKEKVTYVMALCIWLLTSCDGTVTNKNSVSTKEMQELVNNVSVEIKKNNDNSFESYQANVKQYSYNQRIPGRITAPSEYRLSLKKSGNVMLSRIDFDSDFYGDGKARSVICDGKETVVFNSVTKEIEARIPVEEIETFENSENPIFGRISLDAFFTRCRQLSYDIQEDQENSIVCVSLPVSNISAKLIDDEKAVYSRLYFDTQEDVLLGSETQTIEEDGTIVTASNNYLYKEVDGEPVLIGEKIEFENDFQYEIDTSDSMLPRVESEEDIPEVTDQELEKMVKDGGEVWEFEQVIGDPSNPDYTEVIVKTYDDIKINTLDDECFRLPL